MNAADLARMRATQEAHMFDLCVIQRYSSTPDKMNRPQPTYSDDSAGTKCGLDMRPGRKQFGSEMTLLTYDATLRLPITTMLSVNDHIKVTQRFGEPLASPEVYGIVGPIQRGPSGIRILLQRVEL